MSVSLTDLPFRRSARPSRPARTSGLAQDANPALTATFAQLYAAATAKAAAVRRPAAYSLVDLSSLDSLLADDGIDASGAAAEGRAARRAAARSLLIGGIIVGMIVAGALTGVTAMVIQAIQAISRT